MVDVYQKTADDLGISYSLVKRVISSLGKSIRRQLAKPTHIGVMIHNFGAWKAYPYRIDAKIHMLIGQIRKCQRGEIEMTEEDFEGTLDDIYRFFKMRQQVYIYQDNLNTKKTRR